MSNDKPNRLTPEGIFEQAIRQNGDNLTKGNIRSLTKGLKFLKDGQKKTVNDIELTSISSLVSYVAYKQKTCETTICSVLQSKYNIEEVQNLPSHLYQNAINFLVDLEMDKVIN